MALGVALVAIGLGGRRSGSAPQSPRVEGARLAPPALRGVDVAPQRRRRLIDARAAAPRWIRIPAIAVSARVVALGLNLDRTLEVPRRWADAGWYTGGPRPGQRGPAVIAGHVDSVSGPAVFYRLGELRRGALVRIRRADGSTVTYGVEGVERWSKNRFPTGRVYGRTAGSTLRLITCAGAFDKTTGHYLDNVIVYATRVSGADS